MHSPRRPPLPHSTAVMCSKMPLSCPKMQESSDYKSNQSCPKSFGVIPAYYLPRSAEER